MDGPIVVSDVVIEHGDSLGAAALLISGGEVIEVAAGTDTLTHPLAGRAVRADGAGVFVTHGLADLHGHFFRGGWPMAVDPDEVCAPAGVTLAADAGTVGYANFPIFREAVLERARTEIAVFLNVSAVGLQTTAAGVSELVDARLFQPDHVRACVDEHRDVIVGLKVRLIPGQAIPSDELLIESRDLAERCDVRLMVHATGPGVSLAAVASQLRPGDVLTHVFEPDQPGLFDADGRVDPQLLRAQERGVVLDVGHAGIHFDSAAAAEAMRQGLLPDTISSDIHQTHAGVGARSWDRRIPNLLDCMTTMRALGMPTSHVLHAVTRSARTAMDRQRDHSLVGRRLDDLVVLHDTPGAVTFSRGESSASEGTAAFTAATDASWIHRNP